MSVTHVELLRLQQQLIHNAVNWHHHPDHSVAVSELHESVAEFMDAMEKFEVDSNSSAD